MCHVTDRRCINCIFNLSICILLQFSWPLHAPSPPSLERLHKKLSCRGEATRRPQPIVENLAVSQDHSRSFVEERVSKFLFLVCCNCVFILYRCWDI